jgi:HemY protein
MLARLHRQRGDWDGLLKLLPSLKKKKLLPAGELDQLALQAYSHALLDFLIQPDGARLDDLWASIPKHLKDDIRLLRAWVKALQACGRDAQAETVIRKTLKRQWDQDMVLSYGRLDLQDRVRQLSRAESWLNGRSDDPALLLTVARLSMRNELWGKARSYLETSLSIKPTADAYQLYGRLLEQLGESTEASEAFRSGLALATDGTQGLPALGRPKT